jgi:hypothetical protein
MIETIDLHWRRGDRVFALHLRQGKSPLLQVVADDTYARMWRIRLQDGRLGDLMNLDRAKSAAISIALATINAGKDDRETPLEAPLVRLNGRAATQQGRCHEC